MATVVLKMTDYDFYDRDWCDKLIEWLLGPAEDSERFNPLEKPNATQ